MGHRMGYLVNEDIAIHQLEKKQKEFHTTENILMLKYNWTCLMNFWSLQSIIHSANHKKKKGTNFSYYLFSYTCWTTRRLWNTRQCRKREVQYIQKTLAFTGHFLKAGMNADRHYSQSKVQKAEDGHWAVSDETDSTFPEKHLLIVHHGEKEAQAQIGQ